MTTEPVAERRLLLSMLPPGPRERRFAVVVMALSVVVFVGVAPFARVPLGPSTAFIPAYEAALVVNDLITAALLFGQFGIAGSRALLVLACGYLFSALMAVAHALTFPGLFAAGGLLGAGAQSTAWLYMFWHGGFPLAVTAYALLERGDAARAPLAPAALWRAAVAVAALVVALTALATAGEAYLPPIMRGNGYTATMIVVIALVWSLGALGLIALARRRPRSVLDWWLMAVLCAWLCDVALSAVLNAGRFDVGFYAGRVYGLCAASLVLIALMVETIALYARVARAMDVEGKERERHLDEVRAELLHVSRLNELGQMVSALAHEVNQPLTAIGNYLRASQRLIAAGDAPKTLGALDRALNETGRAVEIIKRLRGFIRREESARRVEDLNAIVEETVALALVGAEGRAVAVALRLDPAARMAVIDKIEIQQVLLNLIRNASEAMADGPRRELAIATAPAPEGMVEVMVADTGPGLSDAVRDKLFKPFVTTKAAGMGVGLSICHGIVAAHGGRMWAEANPGGGTVFRFTVPRAAAGISQSAAE
ncbi:MAG TPA: MASE4 domain-containing protein [Candidatus Sulfotelmatobacter sp.]|nr:MASE4 domain-containing protein [Candidatus Sulfotelmatobacter sp.]